MVEILSPGTASRDRQEQFAWYRQYGVREYWIVDPSSESVTVADFSAGSPESHVFDRRATIRSRLLPQFAGAVLEMFH